METFDAIVIGTGGVGSAALMHLANAGLRVLGLDQFPQAHANGSSHGQSRIIRQAYFEHPDYVPLLLRAYELWDQLEQSSERKLFHQVGLLEVGPADGVLIPGVMESVRQHNLPIETLSVRDAEKSYPFPIDPSHQVVFEPMAGYLLVEECVQAHLDVAVRNGAIWRREKVIDWKSVSTAGIEVHTDRDRYSAPSLVISSGAWSKTLLQDLGLGLRIVPKIQYWFDTKDPKIAGEIPAYFFESSNGCFYGFPSIDERGLKVAQHSGGSEVSGPVHLDGVSDDEDLSAVRGFAANALPFASQKLLSHQACMYTFSPDEHFIVDRHPQSTRVAFAAGLSGHGFKFTTVLGELLASMVTESNGSHDAQFLRLDRFDT